MRRTLARLQSPPKRVRPTEPDDPTKDVTVSDVLTPVVRTYGSQAQTLYEDSRSRFRLLDLDATGTPAVPTTAFDEMVVTSVSEALKDRIQLMSSSDATKLYAFGEDHRILMIELTLIDTNTEASWSGNTLEKWSAFYEKARISECAKNGQSVEFRYGDSLVYGGLLSENRTLNSQTPHQIRVSVAMLVSAAF